MLQPEGFMAIIAMVHLVFCPYTGVSESFSMNAMHDVLYHGMNISRYDHLEFPGVVSRSGRSFVGPVIVSIISYPAVALLEMANFNKFASQYIVRIVLATVVILSFRKFRQSVKRLFNRKVAFWFVAITASQFYLMFNLSRPLPSVFALIPCLLACHYWLDHKHLRFLFASAVSVIIFRLELAFLFGLMIALDVKMRRVSMLYLLGCGLPISVGVLATTVCIDSFFWQRLVWPEGEILWFNWNKHSEWLSLLYLGYCLLAILPAMSSTFILVPVGICKHPRVRALLIPAVGFMLLYPLSPRKESTFICILYILPFLNIAAATACHYLWENRLRSKWMMVMTFLIGIHFFVNLVLTALLLNINSQNYPGGQALAELHQLESHNNDVNVYINGFCAENGVSKFTEINRAWRYNRSTTIHLKSATLQEFTHLLVNASESHIKHLRKTHFVLTAVQKFSHLTFDYNSFAITMHKNTSVLVLKKNSVDDSLKILKQLMTWSRLCRVLTFAVLIAAVYIQVVCMQTLLF